MNRYDVVIVGAGPAGLSAAIEAAKNGMKVVVFDENSKPGGQLFKQIHKFFGSKEHKAVEWEIAQKAVTATKNDGVFPIGKDKKVVIFYPKKEELNSIKAGVKKAGINKVDYIFDGEGVSSAADSSIQNADVVICISSCATGGELKNTATVDTLIEKAKNNGKKTLVLSTNLPYDLQKFNNADALVACYGPGVNITAAIYKIFLG